MSEEGDAKNIANGQDSCGCGGDDADCDPKLVPVEDGDARTAPDGQGDGQGAESTVDAPPAKTEIEECEDKLKRTMADYANMMRQKEHDVETRVAARVDSVLADTLQIRDDIERAHEAFAKSGVDASGLEGILKNVNALLEKNGVAEIDALGKHLDPEKHESVSVVDDETVADGTILKVARKGYICHERVLRPTLVEISRRKNV